MPRVQLACLCELAISVRAMPPYTRARLEQQAAAAEGQAADGFKDLEAKITCRWEHVHAYLVPHTPTHKYVYMTMCSQQVLSRRFASEAWEERAGCIPMEARRIRAVESSLPHSSTFAWPSQCKTNHFPCVAILSSSDHGEEPDHERSPEPC